MTAYPLASLTTLLIVLLLFVLAFNVGRARGVYGVKAPAVSGNPLFERIYRVHMNTLENAVILLPALWLYAVYIGDLGAGVGGAIWIVARIGYAVAYQRDPDKRSATFGIAMLAFVGLWAGALWGVLRVLMH